jgi:hypothetical protein
MVLGIGVLHFDLFGFLGGLADPEPELRLNKPRVRAGHCHGAGEKVIFAHGVKDGDYYKRPPVSRPGMKNICRYFFSAAP